jgi:hypothetical protein
MILLALFCLLFYRFDSVDAIGDQSANITVLVRVENGSSIILARQLPDPSLSSPSLRFEGHQMTDDVVVTLLEAHNYLVFPSGDGLFVCFTRFTLFHAIVLVAFSSIIFKIDLRLFSKYSFLKVSKLIH